MVNRKYTPHTKNYNSPKKELAALLASRGREGLGTKFPELVSICGSEGATRRALAELTASGWRLGRKVHADGSAFWFAIADPSNYQFPTRHFHSEPSQFKQAQILPAQRGGVAP
jgi:hypothetical protein